MTLPRCQHCGIRRATRPRQLCDFCARIHAVRVLYPLPERDKTCRGRPGNGGYQLPAEATKARQGTEAKVLVLAARAEAGSALFHPLDGTGERD